MRMDGFYADFTDALKKSIIGLNTSCHSGTGPGHGPDPGHRAPQETTQVELAIDQRSRRKRLCENAISQKAVLNRCRFSFILDADVGMHRVT